MKTIFWKTNYGNKMYLPEIWHIDKPLPKGVDENAVLDKVFKICTRDKSHEPIERELHNILVMPMAQLPKKIVWLSHGLPFFDFTEFWFHEHPEATLETLLAIYYYRLPYI